MSTNTITGPWDVGPGRNIETPDGTFYLSYSTDPKTGAAAFPDFCKLDRIAHSVAALPELLEALEELVSNNYGQPRGVTVPALDKARAAIAKAKGGAA